MLLPTDFHYAIVAFSTIAIYGQTVEIRDEDQLGRLVRAERLRRGLDQRDLAETSGVSLSALRRLEAGNGSTVRTLLSVVTALGVPLVAPTAEVTPSPRRRVSPMPAAPTGLARREERVSWHLHRAVAAKLRTQDGTALIERARTKIPQLRATVRGPLAQQWLDTWEQALAGPRKDLIDTMLRTDTTGIDLRQVSPFAGALTQEERIAAIRRASASTAA